MVATVAGVKDGREEVEVEGGELGVGWRGMGAYMEA